MKKNSKTLILLMTLTALLAGFSGCNTMEGVGEDVGAAGRSLDRTAEDAAN